VWVRADRHGEDVELSVADAGPGIPAERRQRLFDPFERDATSGGSRLGLYLVRRFSSDMGGRVWVTSAPGGGATFEVLLPGV
jgi:signal transduction histidine kinase